jgi:Recombination endonuclease VII
MVIPLDRPANARRRLRGDNSWVKSENEVHLLQQGTPGESKSWLSEPPLRLTPCCRARERGGTIAVVSENACTLLRHKQATFLKALMAYTTEERRVRHNQGSKRYRVHHRGRALLAGQMRNHRKRGCAICIEEYQRLMAATHCAICECEFAKEPRNNPRSPVLDHDHNTGAPRKAICRFCNLGLGHFRDSADLLGKATAYLKGFLCATTVDESPASASPTPTH